MEVITLRIDEEHFKDLQEIERQEKTDRAAVTRKLLASAIYEWKVNHVLALVKERKMTFRKAAEALGCTYAEFINIMERRGIPIGYTEHDLKKDIARYHAPR